MKNTIQSTNSKNRIVGFLMILGFSILLMSGCQQINDAINGNKATNSNTSNSNASTNANANTNADSNVTASINANGPESNKSAAEPELEMPSNEKMQAMVKDALLDFNDAVQKEDFSDFRSKTHKIFQNQFSVEQFNSSFSQFFRIKARLQEETDSLKSLDPEFSTGPVVNKVQGYRVLDVKGRYESSPLPLEFEMQFLPENNVWKLFKIAVREKQ